jgi:nucleoside-diphosphate-sugar epimerase
MRVLIAGGQGFVGLNIAEQLLAQGHAVALFGPNSAPSSFKSGLKDLSGELIIMDGDVSQAADLEHAFVTFKPDRVVNAAAITAGLDREKSSARRIFEVNLFGTIEVLEACIRHKIPRMVQLSTGSVFGEQGRSSAWLDEGSSPALPESLYGISKFAAERTCIRYATKRGLDVTTLRLGTVFGRWEYDTGVRDTLSIPLQLLKSAYAGEAAVLLRECADDWVYSVDVAQGVLAALNIQFNASPLYHLSAGRRWDIAHWCEMMSSAFPGFVYELVDDQTRCTIGRTSSPTRSPMNIERIQSDLGYKPAFSPEAAFIDFIRWGENHLGSNICKKGPPDE